MQIAEGELDDAQVAALLRFHLGEMHRHSPPGRVFALDLSGLAAPDISLWTAREDDTVLGIAALRQLDRAHGELKSMRVHPDHLRRGVARALLLHIVVEGRARGYRRISLETGSGAPFDPALALYRAHGFVEAEAFGDYTRSPFNQFLSLSL